MSGALDPGDWNVVILVTDQERRPRHWPAGWAETNLPAMRRLKRHGLDFARAYTPASMCSPARSSFLTSTYPQQHRVRTTFGPVSYDFPTGGSDVTPTTLRSDLPNLGQLLAALGFEVAYKGKWHVTLPLGGAAHWSQADVDFLARRFGFPGWNAPDAGNSLSNLATLGGGTADNDGRFVAGRARAGSAGLGESALQFLERRGPEDRPFALFLNIVNPHDVFLVPGLLTGSGYAPDDFMKPPYSEIQPPPTWGEDLAGKPQAQQLYARAVAPTFAPAGAAEQYSAFYGFVTQLADRWIGRLIETLEARRLLERTLIFRFADHGEMALSHNLVEKAYNAYEETIGVPFVVSNPRLFPEPLETSAFASTLDLGPTLAGLFGADPAWNRAFRGRDLSPLLLGERGAAPRAEVLFCFDDILDEAISPASVPAWLRALRSELDGRDWMYAVYFQALGGAFEYELYDLTADPLEIRNLAGAAHATAESEAVRRRLHARLLEVQVRDGALPDQFAWPAFRPLAGAPLDPAPLDPAPLDPAPP